MRFFPPELYDIREINCDLKVLIWGMKIKSEVTKDSQVSLFALCYRKDPKEKSFFDKMCRGHLR